MEQKPQKVSLKDILKLAGIGIGGILMFIAFWAIVLFIVGGIIGLLLMGIRQL